MWMQPVGEKPGHLNFFRPETNTDDKGPLIVWVQLTGKNPAPKLGLSGNEHGKAQFGFI